MGPERLCTCRCWPCHNSRCGIDANLQYRYSYSSHVARRCTRSVCILQHNTTRIATKPSLFAKYYYRWERSRRVASASCSVSILASRNALIPVACLHLPFRRRVWNGRRVQGPSQKDTHLKGFYLAFCHCSASIYETRLESTHPLQRWLKEPCQPRSYR